MCLLKYRLAFRESDRRRCRIPNSYLLYFGPIYICNEGTPFSWNEFRGLARCGHERFEQQGALGSSAQTAYRTSAFGHDVGTRGSRGLLHSPQWRPLPDRTQTRVLDDEEDEHTYSLAMNVLSVDKTMAATMFRMIAEQEEK